MSVKYHFILLLLYFYALDMMQTVGFVILKDAVHFIGAASHRIQNASSYSVSLPRRALKTRWTVKD